MVDRHLFAGSQLVLAGRCRSGGPAAVTLRGSVNGQEKTYTFADLALRSEGREPFIARLWVTREIGYLLNQSRLTGASQELIDAVVRWSITYAIATPYTSFFVPEPAAPLPLGDAPPVPTMAPVPQSVVEIEKQVEAAAWVDTAYRTDQPKRELAFGSDEYFVLLAEHPEWSAYLAVSPSLIVVLDGVAHVVLEIGAPMGDATAVPESPVSQPPPALPQPQPTDTAPPPVTANQPSAGQPDTLSTGSVPFCTAPTFGIGMLLLPGLWARRRRSR